MYTRVSNRGTGQTKKSVEDIDARLVVVKILVRIVLVDLGRLEELEAVHAHDYVAVGVDLEQVAVDLVVPEAAHRKVRVVHERGDVLWVAHLEQLLDDETKRQHLVLRRLVQRQRVVHVEAEELDLAQLQASIHEHSSNVISRL